MKDNIENETETSDNNAKGATNPEIPKEAQAPLTIAEKMRNLIQFFTVEPFLLCYVLPIALSALAVQRLNTEKACRSDLNQNEEVCRNVMDGDTLDNMTEEVKATAIQMVSDMTSWQQPLQSSIPAILVLFVGAWSDKTGNRKALMLIPVIGEIISNFGMLWATYFFLEWPLWATALIEVIPTALSGGFSVALMGSFSYVADVTTEESRTFRLGVVSVIVTLGMPLGTSLSGIILEKFGYFGVFGISLVIYIIGFIHTYFRIHNVRSDKTQGSLCEKFLDFFHPKHVWNLICLIVKSPRNRRLKIILVLLAHTVILGPAIGEGTLTFLYTFQKFSISPVDFSLYTTYSILIGAAGTAIAVTLFSKHLKMHDSFLGIIATACKIISSFVYGLAPTMAWFYSGPVFDFFGGAGTTAVRSIGTKVVEPDQVGKMCSLIGLVESLLPIIYTPIYTQVFSNTVKTVPGAFYFVGAVMTMPAFFIFIILFVIYKREQRDVVQHPESKEMHAYDNAVTAI